MSKKNYNDPVGNRSSYVPACSAVPTPTALPLSDFNLTILRNKLASKIRNYNLKTTHSRPACRHGRHRLHNFKRYLKFSTVIPLNTAPLLQMTLSLKGLILRSPWAHCILKTLSYEGVMTASSPVKQVDPLHSHIAKYVLMLWSKNFMQ